MRNKEKLCRAINTFFTVFLLLCWGTFSAIRDQCLDIRLCLGIINVLPSSGSLRILVSFGFSAPFWNLSPAQVCGLFVSLNHFSEVGSQRAPLLTDHSCTITFNSANVYLNIPCVPDISQGT